jgi:putative transposase
MGYPSDISDEAWAVIEPHLTRKAATGRPRTVDLRRVLNAIRYKNRTGCQWDSLPDGFPPKSTVFDYFQKWNEDGTLIRINSHASRLLIARASRPQKPAAIVVLTREKNIKGRKRHLIVDTNGFVLRVLVHAADISESEGGIWLLNEHRDVLQYLETIRVDQGYKTMFVEWVAQFLPCVVEVIEKPKDQVGFAVLPKRWVVERTFAWLGRYRQLSKEYDRRPESTEAWIYLASIDILLERLHSSV